MARGQAERLMVMLREMLDEAGLAWTDLDRIGVGTGPGNFTGLRIAVSAARGLALGLRVPAIGVDRFAALGFGAPAPILASVDARAGRLYLKAPDAAPRLCEATKLPDLILPTGCVAVGDAAPAIAAHYGIASAAPLHPLGTAIARIAASAPPGARPAPLYIRPPDAGPPREPPPVIAP